jgi:hypothetical protein
MSDTTLREQIARRLLIVGLKANMISGGTFEPDDAWAQGVINNMTDTDEGDELNAKADEVIRLMEWSRRRCYDEKWADSWSDDPMKPLTLPPDDWNP